jgi:sporulation protein YlmC with PRC-barrel domain
MTTTMWANRSLLDRLLISADGDHVGMVDDIEMSEPPGSQAPAITALLSGPSALGPRIGGRLGSWWLAIGRRLRPSDDPYPNRVPFDKVVSIDHRGIGLALAADEVPTRRMRGWARDKIINRLPGSGA